MSKLMPYVIILTGVVCLLIGVWLSVKSNLLASLPRGLNASTENAALLLIIGLVCLFSGLGLRR